MPKTKHARQRVRLVGGPLDGEKREVLFPTHTILVSVIPKRLMPRAKPIKRTDIVWVFDPELGDLRGPDMEYEEHTYERQPNGTYRHTGFREVLDHLWRKATKASPPEPAQWPKECYA